jgi:hypothetical protein
VQQPRRSRWRGESRVKKAVFTVCG